MYVALYRKYRPRVFDDVISQDHITTTLKNQLKNGQHSHAYLFTGSRGTGKTTCAMILAKALNCKNLRDGNPCLECESCKSIDENYSDITEIDAASNSKVDDMRELKEEAFYTPLTSKYRIYIIDEVHMLSTAAFNALLKLIEEPPEHVVFILATTEVHKIPATIISRCQRYEFRRIDINDSKKRLLSVASKEGKTLTDDAAFLISKISEGGMRDALSLLDKCFSVDDNVTDETVRECAGLSGTDYLFEISGLIKKSDAAGVLKIFDELNSRSKDAVRLCEELIAHYRSLMLLSSGADESMIRVISSELKRYKEQCGQYSLEQIFECLSLLSETLTSMSRVKDPSLLLQMCFIKLCDPRLDTSAAALASRIDRLESKLREIIVNGYAPPKSAVAPAPKPESLSEAPKKEVPRERPAPQVQNISLPEEPPLPEPPPEPGDMMPGGMEIPMMFDIPASPKKAEEKAESGGFTPLAQWNEIIAGLPLSIRFLVENTTARISGSSIKVEGSDMAVEYAEGEFRKEITEEASRVLGRKVTIITSENVPEENNKTQKKERSKLEIFLERAASRGIGIKEQ